MSTTTVGLLHPGQMGVTIGAAANGHARVLWASQGRSDATRARAHDAGIEDTGTLAAVVNDSQVIVSVCPPHAALDLAGAVARRSFRGIYVDANAISPGKADVVADTVRTGGATYVDGGIIGAPAKQAGTTRLYLSGSRATEVSTLFDGSFVDARVIGDRSDAASALKMAYAAWTKGSDALLLAIRGFASGQGVEEALFSEWSISQTGLKTRSISAADRNAPKAWRFIGEMHEISRSFADAGLPGGFHTGAADVYERLARFKNMTPTCDEVFDQLNGPPGNRRPRRRPNDDII